MRRCLPLRPVVFNLRTVWPRRWFSGWRRKACRLSWLGREGRSWGRFRGRPWRFREDGGTRAPWWEGFRHHHSTNGVSPPPSWQLGCRPSLGSPTRGRPCPCPKGRRCREGGPSGPNTPVSEGFSRRSVTRRAVSSSRALTSQSNLVLLVEITGWQVRNSDSALANHNAGLLV